MPQPDRGETVHGLFASCVRRFPQAVAVIRGPDRFSYAEIDALSDQYALGLEEAGIGRGDFVPVVMESSVELIAAVLAVMKRGAAYSAMSPQWPESRRTELITRLHPKLVITPEVVPALLDSALLGSALLDSARRDASPAAVDVGPSDPYTLLFTSGSTGEPKCVVSSHRSTVRLFDDGGRIPMGPGAVIPQVNAISWDGFALDCLGPLTTGGTTVLTKETVLLPGELSNLRSRHGVNMIYLTPSLFNVLVDEGIDCFAGLRTVMLAGERLSPAHVRRFLTYHSRARLMNLYGPSEAGVVATAHDVTLADCESPRGIPLGTALPRTGLHLLDGDRVCAPGEEGEICLSGDALASGYLDRPDLTALAFVTLDLGHGPTVVYRTGDLGYSSADGLLYFCGRRDLQVKIRGHRIEPQDIELAADRVPGVGLTAVIPQTREMIVESLVLLYTCPQEQVAEADLRAELARVLPDYMVPHQIRRLDRLPLLANGKIDRALLADVLSAAAAVPVGPTGDLAAGDPRDATEVLVARVFAEALGVGSVPRAASMFDLGADSLIAARACARLELATGVRVTVSQFFRTPTVTDLAAWLAAASSRGEPGQNDEPGPRHELIELTPMQAAVVGRSYVTDLAWWFEHPVDLDLLELAAADVHRRHEALHARYVVSGPDFGHAALPADPGRPEFRRLADSATDSAAIEAIKGVLGEPLQLDDGRVWRCAITRSTESGRVLFGTVVHHAAFDGWSSTILADDLSQAYRARRAGAEPDFGPPAESLAQTLADFRRLRAAADVTAQRAYWRAEFAGLPPCQLPGRRPPSEPAGPAVAPEFTATGEQLRPWRRRAEASGMPTFAWVAAVCAGALIAAGAPADVAMMVPVASRGSYLGDRTIKFRMGSLCLRPNGPTRRGDGLLGRMHDACTGAMAAQELLLDNAEIERAIGVPWAQATALQAMPYLLYQDNPPAVIDFGDDRAGRGTPAPQIGASANSEVDVCLEVVPGPAGDLTLKVTTRIDVYPAELADEIGAHFERIIVAGPDKLEC